METSNLVQTHTFRCSLICSLLIDKPPVVFSHFRVKESLINYCNGLSTKTATRYYNYQSSILRAQQAENLGPNDWVPIYSRLWKLIGGDNYLNDLLELERVGEIEIYHSYEVGRCPKQYRVPFGDQDKISLVYTDNKPRKPKTTTNKTKKVFDDQFCRYTSDCYNYLTVIPDELLLANLPSDPQNHARDLRLLRQIKSNQVNVSHHDQLGRICSALILMSRTSRRCVIRRDAKALVLWDIKTCYPKLLLGFFTDDKERDSYRKFIKEVSDIYREVVPHDIKDDEARDQVKSSFGKFYSGGKRNAAYLYYNARWPIFAASIINYKKVNGITVQRALMRLEARLTVLDLLPLCEAAGLFNINMNDGGATTQEDLKLVLELFNKVCMGVLGTTLEVGIKPFPLIKDVIPPADVSNSINNSNSPPSPLSNMCTKVDTNWPLEATKPNSNVTLDVKVSHFETVGPLNSNTYSALDRDNIKIKVKIGIDLQSEHDRMEREYLEKVKSERAAKQTQIDEMIRADREREIADYYARKGISVPAKQAAEPKPASDTPKVSWIELTQAQRAAYGKAQGIRKAAAKAYKDQTIPGKTPEEQAKDTAIACI